MTKKDEKDRVYKIRYLAEPWNKPIPPGGAEDEPAIVEGEESIISSTDNYGYTDTLFVASILEDKKGNISSVAIFDSNNCQYPSVEVLEAVKKAIDFRLEQLGRIPSVCNTIQSKGGKS